MSSGQVHYEIYTMAPRGKWQFHSALESRDAALKQAKELVIGSTAVKVTKETLNPADGNYISVSIFQEGKVTPSSSKPGKTESVESLPCFKPQDLYSYQARKTIARLLQESLNRWKITVLELLHNSGHLERLESSGTILQAAVQKMAIAQSQSGEGSISERVKFLHKLVSDGMVMVYKDREKNRIPKIRNNDIGALATQLSSDPRREYLLNAAIAAHLQECASWNEKLIKILELISAIPASDDDALRQFCLKTVDGYVSEILSASSAIKDLVGEQPDLGAMLQTLTDLSCGRLAIDANTLQGSAILNQHFGAGELPDSRTAILRRVLQEIESPKRLTHDALEMEVKLIRRLASRVVQASGNLLPHDEIISAFRIRSERLVSADTMDTYLNAAQHPPEKIERLLFIGDNITGEANKRKLLTMLQAMLKAPAFTDFFQSTQTPLPLRLQLLCALQNRVLKSELEAARKNEIAGFLDDICLLVAEKNNLFNRICNGQGSALSKCLSLLKLAASNILTQGKALERAQKLALSFLGQPGVLKTYLLKSGEASKEARFEELNTMLRDAGIDPMVALPRFAA
ncbi:MAG TPA: hypothetical protein DCO82_12650 [Alphaproteobacteria bacterium]|jgi:hypothetical protein|nr:hypothetical protein [Alphaproteobacteria bacterium]